QNRTTTGMEAITVDQIGDQRTLPLRGSSCCSYMAQSMERFLGVLGATVPIVERSRPEASIIWARVARPESSKGVFRLAARPSNTRGMPRQKSSSSEQERFLFVSRLPAASLGLGPAPLVLKPGFP